MPSLAANKRGVQLLLGGGAQRDTEPRLPRPYRRSRWIAPAPPLPPLISISIKSTFRLGHRGLAIGRDAGRCRRGPMTVLSQALEGPVGCVSLG